MSNIRTNNSRSIRTAGLGLFVALVLAASACGGSDGDEEAAETPTAEPTAAVLATATASPAPTSAPVAEQTAEQETEVAEPEEEATSVPEEEATPAPEPAVEQPTVEVTPVPEPTAVSTPEAAQQEPPVSPQDDGTDVLEETVEDIPPPPEPVGDVIHIWPQDWDSVPIIEASWEEALLQRPHTIVKGVQVGSVLSLPLDSWDIPPEETVVVRAIETSNGTAKVFFCGYDTWVGTLGEGRILFTKVVIGGNPLTGGPLPPGHMFFDLPFYYRDPARTYPNEYGDIADPGGINIHQVPGIDPSCN